MSHSDVAALLGLPVSRAHAYRKLARWRQQGLTVWQADQVAVVLGCHPCELWPSWWADAREDLPEDRVGCAVAAARVWCVEQQEWERERRRVWVEWVRAVDAAERWADRRAARVGLVSG